MDLFVLISTIDDGICGVPEVLSGKADGVRYVVSWQRSALGNNEQAEAGGTGNEAWDKAVRRLNGRNDVTLATLAGRGLCRNRNHAMSTAVGLMNDPLADAVFIIADDDERFEPDAFVKIRDMYERWPKLDVGLFRLRSTEDNTYFKPYPSSLISWDSRPRSYYPCSVELTFRARVFLAGLRFDERFGLGSEELCAGEEEVFIIDARRKGLRVLVIPKDIARTNPHTTGDNVLAPKMLRSKGAVYAYELGLVGGVLRGVREALGLGIRNRRWPWTLFCEIVHGIKYIHQWKRD